MRHQFGPQGGLISGFFASCAHFCSHPEPHAPFPSPRARMEAQKTVGTFVGTLAGLSSWTKEETEQCRAVPERELQRTEIKSTELLVPEHERFDGPNIQSGLL